jgi:ATPase subunit of ABC transporter with duplicated ATPase domains
MADVAAAGSTEQQAVVLQDLQFSYPGCNAFLKGIDLQLPKGSRTLLIGANGAGVCLAAEQQATSTAAWHQLLLQPAVLAMHAQVYNLNHRKFLVIYKSNRATQAARMLAVKMHCSEMCVCVCVCACVRARARAGKTTLLQLIAGKYMVAR